MNEAVKYLLVFVGALLISGVTSFEVTAYLQTISQNNLLPQTSSNSTQTKVDLTVNQVHFDPVGANYVEVGISELVYNLTIVYSYTTLNGTTIVKSVDYGSYVPSWQGILISPGTIPHLSFRIPDDIIRLSSSVKTNNIDGGSLTWDVIPQVQVIDVYGYS